MAARKCKNVAHNAVDSGDEAVGLNCGILGRFAVWTAVTKKFPAGALLHNVANMSPLPATVVPFQEVWIQFRHGAKAAQFSSPRCPLQGTRENPRIGDPPQPLAV
jgi:hypothetical protein